MTFWGEKMNKPEIIQEFVDNRPDAKGVYGYGSGIFKQYSYTKYDKPQIDMIFIVDDLKDWHLENMTKNEKDYSFTGRIHLSRSSIKKIKGLNKITYFSHIYENGYQFKYGVTEMNDFINNLKTWENVFLAGRFQKPVYEVKSNDEIRDAILENRNKASYIATLLSKRVTTDYKLLNLLCGLSYVGALRMIVAENPKKVENIVLGSYDKLKNIYSFDEDYIKRVGDKIIIDHKKALDRIWELPPALLIYLVDNEVDFDDINSVRMALLSFFSKHNRTEELNESLNGLLTNGLVRSTPYLLAKVKKRIGK